MTSVLVIEDEPEIRELLRTNLEVRGFDVREAIDGSEAIDCIFETTPDLVILDLMMPEIDGFEVLEFIRGRRETQYLPVILLTALSEESDRIRGLSLGAQDYVVKPFSINELMLRVKTFIEQRDREAKLIDRSISEPMTDMFNSRYLKIRLPAVMQESHGEMSMTWIALEGAEKAVDGHGFRLVSKIIRSASEVIKDNLDSHDEAFALGGGFFAVISYRTGRDATEWEIQLANALRSELQMAETGVAISPRVTMATPKLDESPEEFLDRLSSGGKQVGRRLASPADGSQFPKKRRSVAEIIAERHRLRKQGLSP